MLFGALGALAELLLLEHYEGRWQWAPLVALGLASGCCAWSLARPSSSAQRALRWVSLGLVLVGVVGLQRHFQGNLEFELEIYPHLGGFELWWEGLKGATPALAPGFVSFLGLLGLAAGRVR